MIDNLEFFIIVQMSTFSSCFTGFMCLCCQIFTDFYKVNVRITLILLLIFHDEHLLDCKAVWLYLCHIRKGFAVETCTMNMTEQGQTLIVNSETPVIPVNVM